MKTFNRSVKLAGEGRMIDGRTVQALLYDINNDILLATGIIVPTGAGFSKECLFIKTDSVTGKLALFSNQGTTTVANFGIAGERSKAVVALADASATLTAAQLVDSGIFTITPTAARTLTTDTAANILIALPGFRVGDWFDFTLVCLSAFAVTLTAGTGVTLVGGAVVNNVSGTWTARIDSPTAITIYRT